MSFAVIRTGGKQYKVSPGDKHYFERIPAEIGSVVKFDDVLLRSSDAGQVIEGKVVDQIRSRKVIVFKKERRHNYRRKNGHRQYITVVQFDAV